MGLINPDFQTLPELFSSVFSHYRGQESAFPIARKINGAYEPILYHTLEEDVHHFSAFLKHNGVASKDRVAILSENRPGWYLADMAILNLGAINVPLYPSLCPLIKLNSYSTTAVPKQLSYQICCSLAK